MNKSAFVEQIRKKLEASLAAAEREIAVGEANDDHGSTGAEQRAERRMTSLHEKRAARIRSELASLNEFKPQAFSRGSPIGLGAVVDVEDDAGGRSIFLAPCGAGEELAGPGGDGFVSVATPASPIGSAVMNRVVGDTAVVRIGGDVREWTIADVS